MTKKSFILGGLMSISMLCFAGSKSYDVTFASPSAVGTVTLAAGDYKVKVDGANAVFTDAHNNKTFTTAVKLETASKKFQFTAVDATKEGKTERVNAIELGGSTTKLGFEKPAGASTSAVPGGSQQ
jgi:hypothetical protein